MNLELTDEQKALRDTVRRYLAEKASVTTHVRPMLDDPTGTTDEVWAGLAALGATGVLVPQEYGGSGMTMVEAGVVAEELGAALHPGPWLSSAVAAAKTAYFEPDYLSLRERLLTALIAGEKTELTANQWSPITVGRMGSAVTVAERDALAHSLDQ